MKYIILFNSYRHRHQYKPLKEGYEHVGIEYTKSQKKLWDYTDYINKTVIGDYTYLNIKSLEDEWLIWGQILVFDNVDGTEVANSSYGKEFETSSLKPTIDVRPDKRRMGIASNIYEWIEKLTGETLYPDTPHTMKAQMFWANPNRKFGTKH